MAPKFNFLDARNGLDKVVKEVEKEHPKASPTWIRRQAMAIHAERSAARQRVQFASKVCP